MVRHLSSNIGESFSAVPLAIGLFVSACLLVGLCARHAAQVRRKKEEPNTPPKSPLRSPKQLLTISQQVMMHLLDKSAEPEDDAGNDNGGKEEAGLWQKAILMGEKCRPPEFSGAIYYDYAGNRIPEMPKSPRASPLRSFAFNVKKDDAVLEHSSD
ncbi:hypothetical protein F511_36529 [Dorcoceras hygrometricum]|uniref:Uncharacterized protein n=1 Tax=Dorcoceras hygrometricum TaxID=472368 RepID=A0A2Z7CPV4_9LAMI|nr:hypothetical protein F511_36529 [Dorcoceras hygrometricum]